MSGIRAALTWFLLAAAALLSFDALTHRAAKAGIVSGPLFFSVVSVHMLDQVWALTIDVLAAVGVLGLKLDRRDMRAWVALGLGLGLSLTFQALMLASWSQRAMAAVPPLALSMAVWIFEVPRARRATPVPAVDTAVEKRAVPPTARGPGRPTTPTPVHTLTNADREAVRRAVRAGRDVATVVQARGLDPDAVATLVTRWEQSNGRPHATTRPGATTSADDNGDQDVAVEGAA